MGDRRKQALRVQFDGKLNLEFHGVKITSDADSGRGNTVTMGQAKVSCISDSGPYVVVRMADPTTATSSASDDRGTPRPPRGAAATQDPKVL